nr:MAG TPA: hypothetical protein [Caudoviricetes sp.]
MPIAREYVTIGLRRTEVIYTMKWWILWLFLLQKVNFAPTYIISVKI